MKLRKQNEELSERSSKLEEKLKIDQMKNASLFKNAINVRFEKEIQALHKREQEVKDELFSIMNDVDTVKSKLEVLEKERAKNEKESKAVAKLSASAIATMFGGGLNSEVLKIASKKGSRKNRN
ncbi:hypothetical protein MDAP_002232 [Mitosporidium daphniae]|uniref:Uncharacterized protein n=1 Tax=Mitosporidium daphniae TaxID=1485682 RepID=A0A098VQ85_9MICR|nr:uncharacterized protein DI09_4p270 [Mitosporidium daphniae]KGG50944.1 hypothetical protein DI09_4p270 [Mitosporidium daphniae]|eukprot:XP_013237371.1 uncharacterized protein DI09_4p270 [Mitosporidium daphniae]